MSYYPASALPAASASQIFIYDSGGATADNVYATVGALKTAFDAATGPKTIYMATSLTTTAGTWAWAGGAIEGSAGTTFTATTSTVITGLERIGDGINFVSSNTSAA